MAIVGNTLMVNVQTLTNIKCIDPVEIVTPIILGDDKWGSKIETFWAVLQPKFEVLLDTTSGTHINISWAEGRHSMDELRKIPKAVVF